MFSILALYKGDIRFSVFPYNFLIYEVQGREFCMSMWQVAQEMFARKDLILLEGGKTGFFCFIEWEKQQTYQKYVTYFESRQRGTLF